MTAPKNRPPFCPKCGGTDFSDSNICRTCQRARVKRYMQSEAGVAFKERNKPYRVAYNKAYWQASKASVQATAEEDRVAGRLTEAALKSARYKAAHPERLAEAQAKFYASEKGAIYKWSNTAMNAIYKRSSGSPVTAKQLRELWHIQNGVCPLTGRPLQIAGTGHNLDVPSVDRIAPPGGYSLDNIRIVTFQANSARRDGTDADLYAFCRAILAHRDRMKR